MKKTTSVLAFVLLIFFSGCASYQATDLAVLEPQFVKQPSNLKGVSIGCMRFSPEDCLAYLGRDILKKGYQPIQLTFYNETDQNYIFSTAGVSIECVRPEEVAKKVHTSTVGRVTSYTAGALVFTPLIIPAIVDGIRSSKANGKLDSDYADKAKDCLVLSPRSFKKTLIFVPVERFNPGFDLTLIEQDSGEPKVVKMVAI